MGNKIGNEMIVDEYEFRSFPTIIEALREKIPSTDKGSFRTLSQSLEYILWKFPTREREISIANAFASPMFSDDCKRLCAALYLGVNPSILRLGDRSLTEEIIFGYLHELESKSFGSSYIPALMRSSHLSEQIIEAAFEATGDLGRLQALELTPDAMVTPRLINTWKATFSHAGLRAERREANLMAAASRIRKAHPEYADFPDEWVLKVFCGD